MKVELTSDGKLFGNGKLLGIIDFKRKRYISFRSFEKHLFRKHNGLGLSIIILDILQEFGIEDILISLGYYYLETTVGEFIVHGIDHQDKTQGHTDPQLILPLQYWNKKQKKEEHQMALEI